jgi:hypothetical protein
MKDKDMPICVNCIHSYVCEEYNLNRDMLRRRCAYHNDHFLDIKNSVVLSKKEYQKEKLKLFAKAYNQGGKEMATKIFKTLFESIKYCDDAGFELLYPEQVIELAKQCGVEVDKWNSF